MSHLSFLGCEPARCGNWVQSRTVRRPVRCLGRRCLPRHRRWKTRRTKPLTTIPASCRRRPRPMPRAPWRSPHARCSAPTACVVSSYLRVRGTFQTNNGSVDVAQLPPDRTPPPAPTVRRSVFFSVPTQWYDMSTRNHAGSYFIRRSATFRSGADAEPTSYSTEA